MQTERDLLTSFYDYLIANGYPEDSLVMELRAGDRRRVDLAVVDPTTSKPVALFELKGERSDRSIVKAAEQLKSYARELADIDIPLYIVFPSQNAAIFELYRLEEKDAGRPEKLVKKVETVPQYSLLRSSKIRKEIIETVKKRKSALDWFHVICGIVALLLIALLILDLLERIKLNAERLTLIGIIIGLIIIPVASKLKILGVEFERYKKEDKPDKAA